MADLSNFTHKWRAVANHDHRSDANKITKRNRQPVSCQPCRIRKLKCDRGHPCDGCAKRFETASCVYGKVSSNTVANVSTTRKDETRVSTKAQDRLKHLEDLVRSMVPSPTRGYPSPEEAPLLDGILQHAAAAEGAFDKYTIPGSSPYTGSTHWSAILQHITELRTDLGVASACSDPVSEAIDYSKPDSLFGGYRPHSLEQILNTHLPPRIQIDRRVTQYFNAQYMILPFLHAGQFRRQYEKFWADPLSTNIIWISKMFSLCCLAATLQLGASQASSYKAELLQERDSFEAAAGECLVLGNYSKPRPHVVEAFALFLQCKLGKSWDPQSEIALMFGVLIRLAYMMGYHRDGSNFPHQISPFETEMRRRTWAVLRQFDLMVAFQLGIPNNVAPDSWDTKLPSNLLDADFDEDTKVLPTSRPETDLSLVLYFVVKSRIIDAYSRICHHALSFPSKPATFSEIMALDTYARTQADSIPISLQARPMSQSITDPAHEIMIRINISFMWRKSLCVLHRKYMTTDGNDYSYRTCIDTASAMCESFIDVYAEFQPGGTFGTDGWMLTSFTIVDFLLVTMVLCLAMSVSRKKSLTTGRTCEEWLSLEETRHVLDALDKCQAICVELGERSRESKRVSRVLGAVLQKLRDKNPITSRCEDSTTNARNGVLVKSHEDRPTQTSIPISSSDRDAFSLNPLSISDRTSQSAAYPNETRPTLWFSTPSSNPSTNQSIPSSTNPTIQSSYDFKPPLPPPQFPATPAATTSSLDIDPTFFTTFVEDPDSFGAIDWTQVDQFTGFWGGDAGPGPGSQGVIFDGGMAGGSAGESGLANTNIGITGMTGVTGAGAQRNGNAEDWISTPVYSLGGGGMYDPVTGMRRLE